MSLTCPIRAAFVFSSSITPRRRRLFRRHNRWPSGRTKCVSVKCSHPFTAADFMLCYACITGRCSQSPKVDIEVLNPPPISLLLLLAIVTTSTPRSFLRPLQNGAHSCSRLVSHSLITYFSLSITLGLAEDPSARILLHHPPSTPGEYRDSSSSTGLAKWETHELRPSPQTKFGKIRVRVSFGALPFVRPGRSRLDREGGEVDFQFHFKDIRSLPAPD